MTKPITLTAQEIGYAEASFALGVLIDRVVDSHQVTRQLIADMKKVAWARPQSTLARACKAFADALVTMLPDFDATEVVR